MIVIMVIMIMMNEWEKMGCEEISFALVFEAARENRGRRHIVSSGVRGPA